MFQKVEVPAFPGGTSRRLKMYTSELLHTASLGQPSEGAKFASALISLVVSAGLLWSIFTMEKRSSIMEFITDKKDEESESESEDEVEEVETEDIPMKEALVVRRMCDIGCCPRGEKFEAYYSRFSYGELYQRCNDAAEKCEEIEREYVRLREELYFAKENFASVSTSYSHILASSEKLKELPEMRHMESQLEGHSKEEMYMMLSAVHQWKAFQYAPDGLYPYQKNLWEKVLLNEIYRQA